MKKRYKISIIIILFIIVLSISLIFVFKYSSNIKLTIYNDTNISIDNLFISYTNASSDIPVPVIESNSKIKLNIKLPDDFQEGNVKLYYYDHNNIKQEYFIRGYIEKSYTVNVKISIDSVDANGILNIKEPTTQ